MDRSTRSQQASRKPESPSVTRASFKVSLCRRRPPPPLRLNRRLRFIVRSIILTLLCIPAARALNAAEPTATTEELPRLAAIPPEKALETFRIKEGFKLELVAAEPLVNDPVALSFDENGRLFVVEMRDYSERRPEKLGRVRLLEDDNGDGHFDRATIYVDQLQWPTAVIAYDGGVFIGVTPDILFCKDLDGDGKADLRDVVFTGFASDYAPYETNRLNVQAMLNSFSWGLDNRIHGATSTAGGNVGRPGEPTVNLRGRDFSFDPRTLDLRPENGGGQHGMSFNSAGRKFVCSNSSHCRTVLYDSRYTDTNPHYLLPGSSINIAVDGEAAEVFRISPNEPWRVIRTRWRVAGLVPGPVEGGGRPSGYFTGATGISVYRGNAWPAEYKEGLFIADCGSNLIHHKKTRPDGASLKAERPADEQGIEFLASTDTWFRPVQFANAPDGSLHIADMYREVIEHPWSLPAGIKRHLDLNNGNDRGRIYRVVPEGHRQQPPPTLGNATSAELVATLDHANGWHRDTASRLLLQRRDPTALPRLSRFLQDAASAFGRVHALYAIAGLNGLTEEIIRTSLADPAAIVRQHALRLSETLVPNLDSERQDRVWNRLEPLLDDPEPIVRCQLALSLGQLPHPRRLPLLIRMMNGDLSDSSIRSAFLNSTGTNAADLLLDLAGEPEPDAPELLRELALIVGAQNDRVAEVAAEIAHIDQTSRAAVVVSGLGEGLRRRGSSLSSAGIRPLLEPLFARARVTAESMSAPANERARATDLLGLSAYEDANVTLKKLFSPGEPLPVQAAALKALSAFDEEEVGDVLLKGWDQLTPELRKDALAELLVRPSRVTRLLTAMEEGVIRPSEFTSTQADFLRRHRDLELRRRATELFGAPDARDHEALLESYRTALTLRGDTTRGGRIFDERCAACHRLGGRGHVLGPDLASVRTGGREAIMVSLLDPNRAVAPNYVSYEVGLKDGSTVLGVLTDETSGSVVVRQANGLAATILRSQIDRVRSQELSAMPEGLAAGMTPQEMADLLEFVTTE